MLEEGDLDALLACKEQEWKDLQARRIHRLEAALRDTTGQLKEQKEKFDRLKEDFKYNLRVLEERDQELDRYDAMFSRLKTLESTKQAESSELRIQIDKLQEAVSIETRTREELQHQYQQRVKEHQLELEKVHGLKDCDIQQYRQEYEKLKRELERKIQEVEGELALQKQELMVEFDSEMRRREHEFNLRIDEMSNVIFSHELKVKLLTKELEVHRDAREECAVSLQAAENIAREMEKEIRRKELEIKDVSAVKNARIKELEDKLDMLELNWKKEEEIFTRKHQELDRFARERDAVLVTVKEAHAEQVRSLEKNLRELQTSLETLEMEKRRLEWNHTDTLREKEEQLEKLRGELDTMRSGWDAYIAQVSKKTVAKDMQVQCLAEQESKVKTELARYKEDVERYKHQLSQTLERERSLEQAKVQAELDWQRRCEDAERDQYLKNEELIQGLSKARDEAMAELREKERELQDMNVLVQSVTIERDQSVAALHKHGFHSERETQGKGFEQGVLTEGDFPSEEIRRLQQQNSSLRAVIAEMRKEMETLNELIPAATSAARSHDTSVSITEPKVKPDVSLGPFTPEYIRSLEDEVKELKQKCRRQEEQLEEALKAPSKTSAPFPGFPVSADNAYLQNHTRTLNETIGGLRAEKVSIAATLKKQEARVAYQESMVTQLTQQVRLKQNECDELRYNLTNQTKRSDVEIAGLRDHIAGLELQLAEARKEAEEYFKGNLQQNLETVALGNEVSALKLDIASRRAPVVVEQSEMVSQLQDEILLLRQQLYASGPGASLSRYEKANVQTLQAKLKQAVRYISQLTRDKQQLIEMGNKLRAELAGAGLQASFSGSQPTGSVYTSEPTAGPSTIVSQSPKGLAREAQNRLTALEQLQYELTAQELQYAQRDQYKRHPLILHPTSSESEDGTKGKRSNPMGQHARAGDGDKQTIGSKKETTPPELSQSPQLIRPEYSQLYPETRPLSSQSQPLMSSFGADSSLQDIWQMLDRGSSPSICTPREGTEQGAGRSSGAVVERGGPVMNFSCRGSGGGVSVQGRKAEFQEGKKTGKPLSESVVKQKRTAKIRNYNIKH
ncbi:coiled-coil domain-containing protein 57 isoform X2 [Polyodon spathula]|uniref:coiled-coil domain-containing protein 57 isoform X2 n=1 Tax=Polyodon spathula TaxID=7913 RepID=UPI001B7EF837|nr:coiled-coil domain-containing protein 57 isoform X2 [Polyodon spathula]